MRRFRFRNARFLDIDAVFYVVWMLDMTSKLYSREVSGFDCGP